MSADEVPKEPPASINEIAAAIFETAQDSIIVTDIAGTITHWYPAAARLFGYSSDEILGRPIAVLIPEDRGVAFLEIIATTRREETIPAYPTVCRAKDGRVFDVSVSVTPICHPRAGIVGILRILRDIASQETQQRMLTALNQLTDDLHGAASLGDVYSLAVGGLFGALKCDRAAILVAGDSGKLRFAGAVGLSQEFQRTVEGHSPWPEDATEVAPVAISDVDLATIDEHLSAIIRKEGIRALCFVPIAANEALLGKLMLYYNAPYAFAAADIEIAYAIAKQVGIAIQLLKAEEARRQAEEDLRQSRSRLETEAAALARLTEAASKLWSMRDLDAGMRGILSAAVDLTEADKGVVQLVRPDGSRGLSAHHGFDAGMFAVWTPPADTSGFATERALRSGKPVFIEDTETDPSYEIYRETTRYFGYRALHAFPIIGRGGIVLGVLALHFHVPTPADQNNLRRFDLYLRQAADFIDRCRLDDALAESARQEHARAAQLEALMDATPAGVWIAHDKDFKRMTGNKAAMRLLGFNDDRPVANQVAEPANLPMTFFAAGQPLPIEDLPLRRAARGEKVQDFEEEVRFEDGTSRYLFGNAVPLLNRDGGVEGAISAFVDITERKKAEQQQQVLIAELNHRVKNTLATVLAIQQQTFKRAASLEEARKTFEARVMALASAHTRLADSDWSGVALRTLLEQAISIFRKNLENATLRGPPLVMNAKAALSLALAFHELATNAAKYGALSLPDGQLSVSWCRGASHVSVRWSERNGPTVTAPSKKGFGHTFLEKGLIYDLGARFEIAFEPCGVDCVIELPIPRVVAT